MLSPNLYCFCQHLSHFLFFTLKSYLTYSYFTGSSRQETFKGSLPLTASVSWSWTSFVISHPNSNQGQLYLSSRIWWDQGNLDYPGQSFSNTCIIFVKSVITNNNNLQKQRKWDSNKPQNLWAGDFFLSPQVLIHSWIKRIFTFLKQL